jgi:hypothetical protein
MTCLILSCHVSISLVVSLILACSALFYSILVYLSFTVVPAILRWCSELLPHYSSAEHEGKVSRFMKVVGCLLAVA